MQRYERLYDHFEDSVDDRKEAEQLSVFFQHQLYPWKQSINFSVIHKRLRRNKWLSSKPFTCGYNTIRITF